MTNLFTFGLIITSGRLRFQPPPSPSQRETRDKHILPSPVSCFPSLVSRLPSPVSRLLSPVSRLPSPVSHLPSPVSHLPSPTSHLPPPIISSPAALQIFPQPVRQHFPVPGQSESSSHHSPHGSLPSATGQMPGRRFAVGQKDKDQQSSQTTRYWT